MEDVLALYERPSNPKQPVVCLNEKPITLHADVRPATAAKPDREARRDSEYERRGTANAFLTAEPKAGRHFCFPTRDRSGFQFAQVVLELAISHPKATRIHLVMDNLNVHCQKPLTAAFGSQIGSRIWRRFVILHTPKHGSWLNQAEIEIGIVAKGERTDSYWSGIFPPCELRVFLRAQGREASSMQARTYRRATCRT